MPRVVKSTGDRGVDEEIDRLWREIDNLQQKTTPAQTQTTPVQTIIQPAPPPAVISPGSHWHLIGNI